MKIVPGDLMMKAEMSYEGMKAVNSAIALEEIMSRWIIHVWSKH